MSWQICLWIYKIHRSWLRWKSYDNLGEFLLFSSFFFTNTYLVSTHWNCLCETIPMSTHKICYGAKLTKMILNMPFIWRNEICYKQAGKCITDEVSDYLLETAHTSNMSLRCNHNFQAYCISLKLGLILEISTILLTHWCPISLSAISYSSKWEGVSGHYFSYFSMKIYIVGTH